MKTPFDMAQPVKQLQDQIEDAVELSDEGLTLYTAVQEVAIVYNSVFVTGMFVKVCRDWKRTLSAYKT